MFDRYRPAARFLLKSLFSFTPRTGTPLCLVREKSGWVLDEEVGAMQRALSAAGHNAILTDEVRHLRQTVIFFPSADLAFRDLDHIHPSNRITCAYFHGIDESPEFQKRFLKLGRHHRILDGVMVTSEAFRQRILVSGINPKKVHVIPLGIDLERFRPASAEERLAARRRFNLPENSCVVGSFQKDGIGWAKGLEPKLEKGPDLLVAALGDLANDIPDLYVLLTGPARGYVKRGLEELGIPYQHHFLGSLDELPTAYHALDLCLVSSRVEGGPKAALEALACGVALASTPVGQVPNLLQAGLPLILADSFTSQSIAAAAFSALKNRETRQGGTRQKLETYNYKWLVCSYERLFGLPPTIDPPVHA